jgi:3-hydroxyisobutyrate dehydrogenase-like beta-hydroxyacid dehydrogenase/alkylhydroperoxidase/carboxymuconolactone decarboxylase family protein YurZ
VGTTEDVQNEESGRLTAGVIGLGMIGGGVAENLARAGFTPSVFDVRPDAVDRLTGVDKQETEPAAVALASDVVMLAVVNAQQAHDALVGPGGLLTAGKSGLTIVLLSTLSISAVHELAAVCQEHDATLLDAGVTQAGGGLLVTMIGGPDEVVDRVQPVLDAFSKAVVHCGPLGTGMVTKLARNLVTYSGWAIVHEALTLATAGGVEPSTLLAVFRAANDPRTGPLAMLEAQLSDSPLPDSVVSSTNVLAQKDLAAAQELAGEIGVETPIVDVVRPEMPSTLAGEHPKALPEDAWERGIEVATRVYGPDLQSQLVGAERTPAMVDTVEHLFGDIWSRTQLTLRDRRLLAIGATTVLGKQDLLEVQLKGATQNQEFTAAQLREIQLFMTYYAGVENGTSFLYASEPFARELEGH